MYDRFDYSIFIFMLLVFVTSAYILIARYVDYRKKKEAARQALVVSMSREHGAYDREGGE
jgi:tellurite resistance protein TehA-like permease